MTGIRRTKVTGQGSNWFQGGPVMSGERHTEQGHAEGKGQPFLSHSVKTLGTLVGIRPVTVSEY